jgi:hypothetical protein
MERNCEATAIGRLAPNVDSIAAGSVDGLPQVARQCVEDDRLIGLGDVFGGILEVHVDVRLPRPPTAPSMVLLERYRFSRQSVSGMAQHGNT